MNCNTIKELIPLYSDKEASPETEKSVKEHLKECEDCRKFLAEYRKIPHSLDTACKGGCYRFSAIKKKIRLKECLRTTALVLHIIAAAVIVVSAIKRKEK